MRVRRPHILLRLALVPALLAWSVWAGAADAPPGTFPRGQPPPPVVAAANSLEPPPVPVAAPAVAPRRHVDDAARDGTAAQACRLPPVPVWWNDLVTRPLRDPATACPLRVAETVVETLATSELVQAVRELPRARAEEANVARAEFDVRSFVESKFRDISEPVGNLLVTGGPSRWNDHVWLSEGGLRKRNLSGASFNASQQLAHENNNSLFFVPNNQGQARFVVGLTQPLLRGRGRYYNESAIYLAQVDARLAAGQAQQELQRHLAETAKLYWLLYLERTTLLQRQRHLERAEIIARELRARAAWDAAQTQVVRIEATLARRRAELGRSDAGVQNAEARLRSLINSPRLEPPHCREIVPVDPPLTCPDEIELGYQIELAFQHRPELTAAFAELHTASRRVDMAEHELLPLLNVLIEGYTKGLAANSSVGDAWTRSFSTGAPSYTAGMVFEMPFRNAAAKARVRQRQHELSQATHTLRATLASVSAEVDVAVRDVSATRDDARAKEQAVTATAVEVNVLATRWRMLPQADQAAGLILEDLLRAHDRLLEAEEALALALVSHHQALIELRRVTGTLVEFTPLPPVDAPGSSAPAPPPPPPRPQPGPPAQLSPVFAPPPPGAGGPLGFR